MNCINNIEQVQMFVSEIDQIECCSSAIFSRQHTDIKSSFMPQFIESNGHW